MDRQKLSLNERNATLLAIISIFLWSTVATAFKISFRYFSVIQVLAFSSFFSLFFLLFLLLAKGKINALFSQSKSEWINSIILGLINPFLYYLILFNAYNLLKAQEAMILNYSWPLVLAFLSSIIFKRKLSIISWLSLLISFLGIIIIATKGDLLALKFDSLFGVFLAILSAFVWALFWIINLKDKREPILKLTSGFIFGSLFSFMLLILTGGLSNFNANGMISTIYIGLFEMGLTFFLWLTALSLTERTEKISQLVYITPFLSLMFINLFLKETIFISSIIGLIFIIAGIIISRKD